MKNKVFLCIICMLVEFTGQWQVQAQLPVMSLSVGKHTAGINDFVLTSDRTRLVTVSDDKTIKLWSYPSFELLSTIHMPDNGGETGQLSNCAIHPNNRLVVVSGKTGTKRPNARISDVGIYSFYLLDLERQQIVDKIGAFDTPVSSLKFSPNGEFLAASAEMEDAAIYRSDNMEFLCNFHLEDELISSTAFINDSLLYIRSDYRIRFYSIKKDKGKGLKVKMLAKKKVRNLSELRVWQDKGYLGIGDYVFYYDNKNSEICRRKKIESDRPIADFKLFIPNVQYRRIYNKNELAGAGLNSYRVFDISSKGDSIRLGFVYEPLYCFKFGPCQVERLEVAKKETDLEAISMGMKHESFMSWLIDRKWGFISPKGESIYTYQGCITRKDSHGTFFERFLPVPALEIAQWPYPGHVVTLLADGTVRWFSMENGDEVLALYISPEGEWLMWCPEGYYYALSPDAGKNLVCCRQNYLQVETMQPYEMRRLFYNRTEIAKRIGWIFGTPKDNSPSNNWLIEHFMDADYPKIDIVSVKPLTNNEKTLYSVQFDIKNPNPLKYGYLQVSLAVDSISYPLEQISYSGSVGSFLVSLPSESKDFILTLSRENGEFLNETPYHLPEKKQYNRCRALLAGVSHYDIPGFPSLSSSRNDVTDLHYALSQSRLPGGERIIVNDLLDRQATLDNLSKQIDKLASSSTEHDITLFYFSGHGIKRDNTYYLAPSGLQQIDDINHLGIESEQLVTHLKQIKGLKIMVVDACYSGFLLKYSCDDMVIFTSSSVRDVSLGGDHFSTSLFTRAFINSLDCHFWKNKRLTLKMLGESIKEQMDDKRQRPDYKIPPRVENLIWLTH